MKKFLAVLLMAALVITLVACGSKTEEVIDEAKKDAESVVDKAEDAIEKEKDKIEDKISVDGKIGLSVSTQNNPFFVTLADGAKSKADELGVELVVLDAGDDTAKQANDMDDLISQGVSVIIVNPVDSDAISPAVEDAIAAGIKVIAVDRAVNDVEIDCQIASDNVAGGRIAGEYMAELVGQDAQVAELEGIPGASSAVERGSGFHEGVEGKLDIVTSQTANYNRAEGLTVTENILQAHPDIKGIFAHNDEMALGALEAAEAAGKELVIIGFDATDDALEAVKDGRLTATVAQKPDLMGTTSVEVAVKIMQGETVEKEIPVDVELVKK